MSKAGVSQCLMKCDEPDCGKVFEVAFAEIPKWHCLPCPKCGKGEIIDDADMAAWELVNAAVKLSEMIDPDGKLPTAEFRVNTQRMKEGSKP